MKKKAHNALPPKVAKERYLKRISDWKKQHSKAVTLAFNADTEADILEWLENHRPKQAYIRSLIRADMEKSPNDSR